jgi:hypothetical protein
MPLIGILPAGITPRSAPLCSQLVCMYPGQPLSNMMHDKGSGCQRLTKQWSPAASAIFQYRLRCHLHFFE